MNVRILLVLLFFPFQALAQGFAGLGAGAEGFSVPQPGRHFTFPADHGPHPDYRIEWWYLTANLQGPDGTNYGIQWTLFRSALAPVEKPGWQSPQIWFAHAALTTPDAHHVAERVARGGIGQAGVTTAPFDAWIDDWRLYGPRFDTLAVTARGTDFQYDLNLTAQGPLIFHGDQGYSVKSNKGQASYYYAQPFFDMSGTLNVAGQTIPVTGHGWLDREWSSQPLAEDQTGWDWFSLSFDSGDKLMGFLLRQTDGSLFTSGTWITAKGTATPLAPGQFTAQALDTSALGKKTIPTTWRVQLAEKDLDVTVTALNPSAWMAVSIPYWEGPVTVTGSHSGTGYLEMTGYE